MSRWQRGEEVAARFVVIGRLAAGGMAEVYVAEMSLAHSARRRVALKRIHAHLTEDSQFVSMFVDEARLASMLSHPGIIPVLDAVEWRGDLLLVLDYVPGWDLSAVLSTAKAKDIRMPLSVAVQIALGLAETLAYVHDAVDHDGRPMSIVHRDVTPSNVLIAHDGSVRLLDFGVAKAAQQATKTATGALKGKFAYMSPEQARGGDVDRRSDLYALGLVLFEMLTGERAVRGQTDMGTLQAALAPKHIALSEMRPDAPAELGGLLTTLLAVDVEHRHHSAEEVIRHLENVRAAIGGAGGLRIREYVQSVMGSTHRPIDDGRSSLDRALALAAGLEEGPKTGTRKVGRGPDGTGEIITMPRSLLGKPAPTLPAAPEAATNADGSSGVVSRDSLINADTVLAPSEVPPRRRRRWPLVLGLAVLLGAGGGAAVYVDSQSPQDTSASTEDPIPPTADPPRDPPPVGMGFVVVQTDPPGASLFLDDEPLEGETPAVLELPAGTRGELRIELDDHVGAAASIDVVGGETVRVERELARSPGRLEVSSRPSGATVYVDDEPRGRTPLVLDDMPREAVEVRVSRADHGTFRTTARLDERAEVIVEARLSAVAEETHRVVISAVSGGRPAYSARVTVSSLQGASRTQDVVWRGQLPAGTHRVTASDGERNASRTITVQPGARNTFQIALD